MNLAKPNKTIQQHTDDLLIQANLLKEYKYISKEQYELLKTACEIHDLGKANDKFQARILTSQKFNHKEEVPHNILSGHMLMAEDFQQLEHYYIVLFAVLYHHHYVDVFAYLQDRNNVVKIRNALNSINTTNKITSRLSQKTISEMKKIMQIPLAIQTKGLLQKCDHTASAEIICEYPPNFLEEKLQKFSQSNHIIWNDMQKYCLENKSNNLIIVGQTGLGKTEAGLLWAGNSKCFFVLPLRTAINAMYSRIENTILDNELILKRLAILHSSSLSYYLKSKDEESEQLLAYEKEGKKWSIPLNITTMDQIFDFVFKYPSYELKLATLSYSKIIIDEIQMYSPDLLAYIIFGLKRIVQLGGKVAIITATLPPFIQDLLTSSAKLSLFDEAQPVAIDFLPTKTFINNSLERHHVCVKDVELNAEDIVNLYKQDNLASCKILVVCNTIKKARQIYEQLQAEIPEEKLFILHSSFIQKDRKQLEEEIKQFGQTYNKEGTVDYQHGIWISTSLVEASLDIDFDYLYTELQELSSLFQRFGRCNRKGAKEVSSTNCFVYTKIDDSLLTHGSKGFIDKDLFELSKKAITGIEGVLSEIKKLELIDILTTENLVGSAYQKQYDEAWLKLQTTELYKISPKEIKLREIFTQDIIPQQIYEEFESEIENSLQILQGDSSDTDKILAQDNIMQYTVSVPYYVLLNYSTHPKVASPKVLKLDNYNEIYVIGLEYNKAGLIPDAFIIESDEGVFL